MTRKPREITGPTDPESPWHGAEVTLRVIRREEADRGMLLGLFAEWHFGGAQPANLLSVAAIDIVRMESVWEGSRHLGNRVWFSYLDEYTAGWGNDPLWIVTRLPGQEPRPS